MAFRNQKSRSITVEKEGYLSVKKDGSNVKQKDKCWQQRYIVLRKSFGDGTFLEWYENFEAFIGHKSSKKLQLANEVDYIGPVDLGKEYSYAFILFGKGQNKLQMAAKNEQERSEWIKALNQCLQNGQKSNPTSPTISRRDGTGYPVKLKDYTCITSQDVLRDADRDYLLFVGQKCIALHKGDSQDEEKPVLSWLLQNIKSYESRPLEQNPTQRLLSIDTGRRSSTGQGTFNFFTPHGDQIKNQISLNTKRTYLTKINSLDNFGSDNLYSSSPERTFSTPARSFSLMSTSPRRATVSSREGPIPFHKYDSPTRDGYAHYVQQPNGYVDIFTDQRQVEESRMRHRSRTSVSTPKSPNSDDHPTYVDITPETQQGYIQVLPNGSDAASQYIDVLPEHSPDSGDHAYVAILGEDQTHHDYVEVLDEKKSRDKGSTASDDHPAYIEVLGDDEPTNQSGNRGISLADSDEIYIDVDENRKKYESRKRHFESRAQRFETRETHFESREEHMEIREHFESHEEHVKTSSVSREVHVTHNSSSRDSHHESRQTCGSTASVSSRSPRWPHSVTSQTSTEFGSFSSENDVFQDREINMVPEVFVEPSAKSEDIAARSDIAPTNSDAFSTKSNNSSSKPEENLLTCTNNLTKPPLTPKKPVLMVSKSATLPTKSEGLASNVDVNSKDVNESRNDGSPKPGDSRSVKARSWHSENENDPPYNSGNSTSTSESDQPEDSDDEDVRDDLASEGRYRSHTEGELQGIKANGKGVDPSMLTALEMSLTNPQQFNPSPNRHPPLTRETAYTQDQVIAQLENPIQGMSKLPDTKNTAVEFKYICSTCGWHKRSKKRPSLKPTFRTKQCPICNSPLKGQKSKEKSSSGFLKNLKNKRRRSDEKIDKKDSDIMRPERPSSVPKPIFIKQMRDPTTFISRHSPSLDPKRSERGLAPSPLTAFNAISIDGGEPRGSVSCDDGTSSGKSCAVGTLSDGGDSCSLSPHKTVLPIPSLNRTLASSPSDTCPLGRTKSSSLVGGGGEAAHAVDVPECEKIPRKNSALTLPTLPEVEDPGNLTHQTCLIPGTPPPMIPPRTRAPPVPPRRGSSPLAIPREDNTHKLRRAQTDPTFPLPARSPPQQKPKNRISRTLTDPGKDISSSDNNIRNAVSLGNLLEDGNDGLLGTKMVSLSLGDDIDSIDTSASPPPLPPRRGSGQAAIQPPLPRRVTNETERFANHSDSARIEARSPVEARRTLPERTPSPGNGSRKVPLSGKRSLDAKRDFQTRKPLYSTHVGEL